MSDQKDRNNEKSKHSKPGQESSQTGDRSKSGAGKDASKQPMKGDSDGDRQRASQKAQQASGGSPESKKQQEPRK